MSRGTFDTRRSGKLKLTTPNRAKTNASRLHGRHEARRDPDISNPARRIPVGLSSSSVYPLSVPECFTTASHLGYDGVEIMVSSNAISQSAAAINELSAHYRMPVLSIHAPTLLVMQRVWGKDAWSKVERSAELAAAVGADTVVVHPPFRWQSDYAENFVSGVRSIAANTGVHIAVENMFPWRTGLREVMVYLPGWDPVGQDYDDVTLDFSHAATAGSDVLHMIDSLGDRLRHIHLADGSGSLKDEHLAPGYGAQPVAHALRALAERGWNGSVVVEVNTRKTKSLAERDELLAHSLNFARMHMGHEHIQAFEADA